MWPIDLLFHLNLLNIKKNPFVKYVLSIYGSDTLKRQTWTPLHKLNININLSNMFSCVGVFNVIQTIALAPGLCT